MMCPLPSHGLSGTGVEAVVSVKDVLRSSLTHLIKKAGDVPAFEIERNHRPVGSWTAADGSLPEEQE